MMGATRIEWAGRTWKPIPGWSRFTASDDGQVRGPSGRILKPSANKSGHLSIVRKNGKTHSRKLWIHHAVLLAFIGPCPMGQECRHLNGDPTDNRLKNLRWGTRIEQRADARRHGTLPTGERSGTAKLTYAQVLTIRQRRVAGEGIRALARLFGVSHTEVSRIVRRKKWSDG